MKATKYRRIEAAKRFVKPKVSIIKPPTAGLIMPVIEGIATESKLIITARSLASLSLNRRRLKLGQKVAIPSPYANPRKTGFLT